MDQSLIHDLNGDDDDVGWGTNVGVVDNGGEADDGKLLHEFLEGLLAKCDAYNDSLAASSGVKDSNQGCGKEVEDDDDDDCVILDGDPDKAGVDQSENVAVGDDSDDLVIVGETGQV